MKIAKNKQTLFIVCLTIIMLIACMGLMAITHQSINANAAENSTENNNDTSNDNIVINTTSGMNYDRTNFVGTEHPIVSDANGDKLFYSVFTDDGTDFSDLDQTHKFYLKNDIVINPDKNSSTGNLVWNPTVFKSVLDGKTEDGGRKTITINANFSSGSRDSFGLFSVNEGIIRNINFVINGSINAIDVKNVGAIIGINKGQIINCSFTINGAVNERISQASTYNVGCLIGRNETDIQKCDINIVGGLDVSKKANTNPSNMTVFAGGVIGLNKAKIEYCNIDMKGQITVNSYNSTNIYAAGGIVGCSEDSTIFASNLIIGGSVSTMGVEAFNGYSGGVIGAVKNDASPKIEDCAITIGATIDSNSGDINGDKSKCQNAAGGIIGLYRSDQTSANTFIHNLVKFKGQAKNITSTKTRGILVGNGDFSHWNNPNGLSVSWMIYDKYFEKTCEDLVGKNVNNPILQAISGTDTIEQANKIKFGKVICNSGGELLPKIVFNTVSNEVDGQVHQNIEYSSKVLANPLNAPLYAWAGDTSNTDTFFNLENTTNNDLVKVNEDGTGFYTPEHYGKIEAIFFKHTIDNAGDLNALADLVNSGINYEWMDVSVTKDLFGTGRFKPIGTLANPWKADFDGGNHSISFSKESQINATSEYVGIFGVNKGLIKDFNINFGGKLIAESPYNKDVYAGVVAGYNLGNIQNIHVVISSGAKIFAKQSYVKKIAVSGGFAGINQSNITNSSLKLQGSVYASKIKKGNTESKDIELFAGGFVGISSGESNKLSNISVIITGEVASTNYNFDYDEDYTVNANMYSGGFVAKGENTIIESCVLSVSKIVKNGNDVLNRHIDTYGTKGTKKSKVFIVDTSSVSLNDNVWVALDKEDYGSINSTQLGCNTSIGIAYITGSTINPSVSNDIVTLSVPTEENQVFVGWFRDKKETVLETCKNNFIELSTYTGNENIGNGVYPNNRYYALVMSLSITKNSQLDKIATYTNIGNDFKGVEFTLGTDIYINDVISNYKSIGYYTDEYNNMPFNGTFNGNGLSINFNTNVTSNGDLALFGYLGKYGQVHSLTLNINKQFKSDDGKYVAGLVSYNDGIIGSAHSSYKTKVNFNFDEGANPQALILNENTSNSIIYMGGMCGINNNIIQNTIVNLKGKIVFNNMSSYDIDAYIGGLTGENNGFIRNNIVNINKSFKVIPGKQTIKDQDDQDIEIEVGDFRIGGINGTHNGVMSNCVSNIYEFDYITKNTYNVGGLNGYTSQQLSPTLKFDTKVINSWMILHRISEDSINLKPMHPAGNYANKNIDKGNKLEVVNNGSIDVTFEIFNNINFDDLSSKTIKERNEFYRNIDNLDRIIFKAVSEEIDFYKYMAYDFNPQNDPNPNYLKGKDYILTKILDYDQDDISIDDFILNVRSGDNLCIYPVFAIKDISTKNDLDKISKNINEYTYEQYPQIVYNLQNNINLTSEFVGIGTKSHPFNGVLKGNDNTISIIAKNNDDQIFSGIFNHIGKSGKVEFLNIIVEKSTYIVTENGKNKIYHYYLKNNKLGVLAVENKGILRNINLTVCSILKGESGDEDSIVGGICAENYGSIFNTIVKFRYDSNDHVNGGIESDNYAGAIAGINYGIIGRNSNQDIQVVFEKDSTFKNTDKSCDVNMGAVVGLNKENASISNAFINLTGFFEINSNANTVNIGGICGTNEGYIYNLYMSFDYENSNYLKISKPKEKVNFGLIAGSQNGGIIGSYVNKSVEIDNPGLVKVYINEQILFNANLTNVNLGGIVGYLQSGDVKNFNININNKLSGINVGAVVGMSDEGTHIGINNANDNYNVVNINNGAVLEGNLVGGIIGHNFSAIENIQLNIDGKLIGKASSKIGGAIGVNSINIENSLKNIVVYLNYNENYKNIIKSPGENSFAGTFTGLENANKLIAYNVWVVSNNSLILDTLGKMADNSLNIETNGVNSLKVVGKASLKVYYDGPNIVIENISKNLVGDASKVLYSDISTGTLVPKVYNKNTYKIKTDFTASTKDLNLHFSCYKLEIENINDLIKLAEHFNYTDYFYNVKFTLKNNINVSSNYSLLPVGTFESQFNGIFDGCNHTIKFESGSAINSLKYTGLFGYTSENSVIKNLHLEIRDGVFIGNSNSIYTGGLIGYSNGYIENCIVNLNSKLKCKQTDADKEKEENDKNVNVMSNVGGFIGYLSEKSTMSNNNGLIYRNESKVVSNDIAHNIHTINIYGDGFKNGKDDITVDDSFSISANKEFEINHVKKYYWYDGNDTSGDIKYYQNVVFNKSYTLSYISLKIKDYFDLLKFSENNNLYKSDKITVTLMNNITVSDEEFISIGNYDKPFTGTFDGNNKTITFNNMNFKDVKYHGLFGNVSGNGTIKNLIFNIENDEKVIGSDNCIAAGALAGNFAGKKVENVIVSCYSDVKCYNYEGALFGCLEENGENQIENTWLILSSDSKIKTIGNTNENKNVNVIHTAGGKNILKSIKTNGDVTTINIEIQNGTGFIDESTKFFLGDTIIESSGNDYQNKNYIAVYINTNISNAEQFIDFANDINNGYNYENITFVLKENIIIDSGLVPVGGVINNNLVKFKGIFDGKNKRIKVKCKIEGDYAGLFGALDEKGIIKNLNLVIENTIGNTDDKNKSTYASGVVAFNEGTIENVVFTQDSFCKIFAENNSPFANEGNTYESLKGNYLGCWLINYNSKDNKNYYNKRKDAVADAKIDDTAKDKALNSILILGRGYVNVSTYDIETKTYFEISYQTIIDNKTTDIVYKNFDAKNAKYISKNNLEYDCVNNKLSNSKDLARLAKDVNDGFDFYGITFTFDKDIVLEQNNDIYSETIKFNGFGSKENPFNGTIDGKGKKLSFEFNESLFVMNGTYAGFIRYMGKDGTLCNLKVDLKARIGNQGQSGSTFAGFVAFNEGNINNLIVVGYDSKIYCNEEENNYSQKGLVVGYDASLNIFNTWAVIPSYNDIMAAGNDETSGANKLKVVGAGKIEANFDADFNILFTKGADELDIAGWYKDYANSKPISVKDNTYKPDTDLLSQKYEVVIIKLKLSNQNDLEVLCKDINIGKYEFNNVKFELTDNISIEKFVLSNTEDEQFLLGTEKSPFKGILEGNGKSITINGGYGLFKYNEGTIQNLNIIVENISELNEDNFGALVYYNKGIIRNCTVDIKKSIAKTGNVGGIVGINKGKILESSTVLEEIDENSAPIILQGFNVGLIAGQSHKIIESCKADIFGTIKGLSEGDINVGGIVGNIENGSVEKVITVLHSTGAIIADCQVKDNSANTSYAGGIAGKVRGYINDSIVHLESSNINSLNAKINKKGLFAGYCNNNILNSWVVNNTDVNELNINSIGDGTETTNLLNIYGKGNLTEEVDEDGNIIFTKVKSKSVIDGWYKAKNELIYYQDSIYGSISANNNNYIPNKNLNGRKISVVFINTVIENAENLNEIADAVASGMSVSDIEFNLVKDIIIDVNSIKTIGTIDNPFNYIFNGAKYNDDDEYIGNYRILIKNGDTEIDITNSIFGIIGNRGLIKNVDFILNNAVVGNENREFSAVISEVNMGKITNCSVNIDSNSKIIGNVAAGFVAVNQGIIEKSSLTNDGEILAKNSLNENIAGGFVAKNLGIIKNGNTVLNNGTIKATGSVVNYAALGVTKNQALVNNFTILDSDNPNSCVESISTENSLYNSYAGILTVTNSGVLENIIIDYHKSVKAEGDKSNLAAIIACNNINEISNIVIIKPNLDKLEANQKGIVINDNSKVYNGDKIVDETNITNVWILTTQFNNYGSVYNVLVDTLNKAKVQIRQELDENYIQFNYESNDNKFLVYYKYDNDGNKLDNSVLFNDDFSITTDGDNKLYTFSPNKSCRNIFVGPDYSNLISSGNELKSYALAINNSMLKNCNVILNNDVVLTGKFTSIGKDFDNKFNYTFDGNGHSITMDKDIEFVLSNYNALFGYNNGTISNLHVNVNYNNNKDIRTAGLVFQNEKTLNQIVVTLNGDIKDSNFNSIAINNTNSDYNKNDINIWTISLLNNIPKHIGKFIKINGNGNINLQYNSSFVFNAVPNENNILIGYYREDNTYYKNDTSINSNDFNDSFYNLDFLTTKISSQKDIENIVRVNNVLKYSLENITFDVVNDFEITDTFNSIGTNEYSFKGIFNGNGHKITISEINSSDNNELFSKTSNDAVVKNLILETYNFTSNDKNAGLVNYASGTFENILVIDNEKTALFNPIYNRKSATATFNNVWLVGLNGLSYDTQEDINKVTCVGNGEVEYELNDESNFVLTTPESDEYIFAGWYNKNTDEISKSKVYTLNNNSTNESIKLYFINSRIENQDQFIDFVNVVNRGFSMEGNQIFLNNDITIHNPDVFITGEFKGTFDGQHNKITYNTIAYGENDSIYFINKNLGVIQNLIFEITDEVNSDNEVNLFVKDNSTLENGEVINGTLNNVVVKYPFENASTYNLIANGGNITQSWVITCTDVNVDQSNELVYDISNDVTISYENDTYKFELNDTDSVKSKIPYFYNNDNLINDDKVNFNVLTGNYENSKIKAVMTNNIASSQEFMLFVNYINSNLIENQGNYELTDNIKINNTADAIITIGTNENLFVGNLNGNGNTIEINKIYNYLFKNRDNLINNLNIVVTDNVDESLVVFDHENNQTLNNVVTYFKGDINVDLNNCIGEGDLNNCYFISKNNQTISQTDAKQIVLNGNGVIQIVHNNGNISFEGLNLESNKYIGFIRNDSLITNPLISNDADLENKTVFEFINLNIDSEESLINIARVISELGYVCNDTLNILNDIEITNNFNKSIGLADNKFNGVVNGNFNTININSLNFDSLFVSDTMTLNDLAFNFTKQINNYTDGDNLIVNGNATVNNTFAVCSKDNDNNILRPGVDMEIIVLENVFSNKNNVSILNENGVFKIKALPEFDNDYDLRGFYSNAYISENNNDSFDYIYTISNENRRVNVRFMQRYTINFVTNIETLDVFNEMPELTGGKKYWEDDSEINLVISDIGNGFLLKGIKLAELNGEGKYVGIGDNLNTDSTQPLNATITTINSNKTYIAEFEKFIISNKNLVYNSEQLGIKINNDLSGYNTQIYYTRTSDDETVYETLSTKPTDAGNYTVDGYIKNSNDVVVGKFIDIFTIEQYTIKINNKNDATINNKYYDTTDKAVVTFNDFSFANDEHSDYVDLSNLKFVFDSCDAGKHKIRRIEGDILPNPAYINDDTYKNIYKNYKFQTPVGEFLTYKEDGIKTNYYAEIYKLEVEVVVDDNQYKFYGEDDPEITFSLIFDTDKVSDEAIIRNDLVGSLARNTQSSNPKFDQVADYAINRGNLRSESGNYLIVYNGYDKYFKIVKRKVQIEFDDITVQYGNVPQFKYTVYLLNGEGSKIQNDDDSYETITSNKLILSMLYDKNYNYYPILTEDDTDSHTYKIGFEYDSLHKNYEIENMTEKCNMTVVKRDINPNITNNSRVYGKKYSKVSIFANELLFGHNIVVNHDALMNYTDVNEYDFDIKVMDEKDNDISKYYNIICTDKYTITPKKLFIKPDKLFKVYKENDPEILTYTVDLPEGVILDGKLVRAEGENAGYYQVNMGDLNITNNSNYVLAIIDNEEAFEIKPKTLTITIENAEKVYGESNDVLDIKYSFTGFLEGEEPEVSLDKIVQVAIPGTNGDNVGTYKLSGKFIISDPNYNSYVVKEGELTINPLVVEIKTFNASVEYGYNGSASYALMDNQPITDVKILKLRFKDFSEYTAGYKAIIPESCGNKNYKVVVNKDNVGMLKVTKRKLTIKPKVPNISVVEGTENIKVDYIIDGILKDGDKVSGSLSYDGLTSVGTYDITKGDLKIKNASSYDIEYQLDGCTLTITKKPINAGVVAAAAGGGAVGVSGLGISIFMVLKKLKKAKIK